MRRKKRTLVKTSKFKRLFSNFRLKTCAKVAAVLAILSLAVWSYNLIQVEINGLQIITVSQVQRIDVDIIQKDKHRQKSAQANITKFVRESLQKKKRMTLRNLSRALQQQFSAEQVSVVSLNHEEIYIRLKPRRPVFALSENSNLRLSDRGEVYKETYLSAEGLPLLRGLISTDSQHSQVDPEGRLLLDLQKQEAAKQSLELLAAMQRHQLDYKEVQYIPYRGFALTSSATFPPIIIGDKKFQERFERLKSLTKRTDVARSTVRIELDYDDKAFIQEKTF